MKQLFDKENKLKRMNPFRILNHISKSC